MDAKDVTYSPNLSLILPSQHKTDSDLINLLPDELILKIFEYLNYNSFCSASSTCVRWKTISKDSSLFQEELLIKALQKTTPQCSPWIHEPGGSNHFIPRAHIVHENKGLLMVVSESLYLMTVSSKNPPPPLLGECSYIGILNSNLWFHKPPDTLIKIKKEEIISGVKEEIGSSKDGEKITNEISIQKALNDSGIPDYKFTFLQYFPYSQDQLIIVDHEGLICLWDAKSEKITNSQNIFSDTSVIQASTQKKTINLTQRVGNFLILLLSGAQFRYAWFDLNLFLRDEYALKKIIHPSLALADGWKLTNSSHLFVSDDENCVSSLAIGDYKNDEEFTEGCKSVWQYQVQSTLVDGRILLDKLPSPTLKIVNDEWVIFTYKSYSENNEGRAISVLEAQKGGHVFDIDLGNAYNAKIWLFKNILIHQKEVPTQIELWSISHKECLGTIDLAKYMENEIGEFDITDFKFFGKKCYIVLATKQNFTVLMYDLQLNSPSSNDTTTPTRVIPPIPQNNAHLFSSINVWNSFVRLVTWIKDSFSPITRLARRILGF